jgi:GTP pyrophosphokinase
MAALLHDVMEDQGITKSELAEKFGPKVSELVDGLTKLDKLEFQSREQAQAESFRKMLLAMARDAGHPGQAGRSHAQHAHARFRAAREAAPDRAEDHGDLRADRASAGSQYDLSRAAGTVVQGWLAIPLRHARESREGCARQPARSGQADPGSRAVRAGRPASWRSLSGREKTLYSIYRKMHDKQLSFSQVLDVYGFRVVVETQMHCYMAMGALHGLYKPMPGKFKDYIAIPKINGYQSLHTTLVGPFGTPVEFQIRTRGCTRSPRPAWLRTDVQASGRSCQRYPAAGAPVAAVAARYPEPDRRFAGIPRTRQDRPVPGRRVRVHAEGHIRALPRGATALDFAYAVHSDLGNQCVAVKINNELPLRTELKSGDIVEVVTAPYSKPNPAWLAFVRTGKARAAIRHYLKTTKLDEAIQLGERLLEQSTRQLGIELKAVPQSVWDRMIQWTGNKLKEDIFADLALGRRVPAVVARRMEILLQELSGDVDSALLAAVQTFAGEDAPAVPITGDEGMSMIFSACCRPIPGDSIVGYLGKGEGLQIHVQDCKVAKRLHSKDPEHWIEVMWAKKTTRAFDVSIKIMVRNVKGIVAAWPRT